MKSYWRYLLLFLLFIAVTTWFGIIYYPDAKLRVIACDVGQGDAILVTFKSTQVLIDAGPGRKVLDCLDNNIAFWDREIEVGILSHPQKDHYRGFLDVLKHYNVQSFVTTGLYSGNQDFQLLKDQVTGQGVRVIKTADGMKLRVGLIYLDILHPSKDFLAQESTPVSGKNDKVLGIYTSEKDPNEFSIVAVLRYKDFEALFTGDISPKLSNEIAVKLTEEGLSNLEYIKIPHHGSRNGLTEHLLDVVKPKIAVISSGKNNSYGHPHKETLELLSKYEVSVLRTDELGSVVVESDGENYWLKK